MMAFQICAQEHSRVAGSRGMADEDDLLGMGQILGDLLVPGVFLGNTLAQVVSFLAVDQVVMESMGIVGLYRDFIFRKIDAAVVVNVRGMMVDYNNHSTGLV